MQLSLTGSQCYKKKNVWYFYLPKHSLLSQRDIFKQHLALYSFHLHIFSFGSCSVHVALYDQAAPPESMSSIWLTQGHFHGSCCWEEVGGGSHGGFPVTSLQPKLKVAAIPWKWKLALWCPEMHKKNPSCFGNSSAEPTKPFLSPMKVESLHAGIFQNVSV